MNARSKAAIVLHGEYSKPDDLWAWTEGADVVIAADGAADTLMSLGIDPDIVIGDLDSLRVDSREELREKLVQVEDQDSTDFQKALAYACEQCSAVSVAVLAYEGKRVDHMLSAIFASAGYAGRVRLRLISGDSQGHVLGEGAHRLTTRAALRVSLLPLGEVRIEQGDGLEYAVTGLSLAIGGRDGVSNRAVGDEVALEISRGTLVAFVERFDEEEKW